MPYHAHFSIIHWSQVRDALFFVYQRRKGTDNMVSLPKELSFSLSKGDHQGREMISLDKALAPCVRIWVSIPHGPCYLDLLVHIYNPSVDTQEAEKGELLGSSGASFSALCKAITIKTTTTNNQTKMTLALIPHPTRGKFHQPRMNLESTV